MKTLLWLLCAIALGSYICPQLRDPDLWWHLSAGRWILSHLTVPFVDHWNLFGAGKPWVAYSWSHELIYALFERAGGIGGVAILQILLAWGIAVSFFYLFSKLARDSFFGALIAILALCSCTGHYGLRPQSLVWILFLGVITVSDEMGREGITARRALALMGLMCVWANSHITTVFGVLVAAGWLFQFPKERTATGLLNENLLAAKVAALAFLGTLFTPYLGYEWIIFFLKSGHPIAHSSIMEFGPATILDYGTGLLAVTTFLLLTFLYNQPHVVPLPRLIIALVLLIGGLAVIKFSPFAVIFAGALICQIWRERRAETASHLRNLEEGIVRLRQVCERVQGQGMAFLLAASAMVRCVGLYHRPLDPTIPPVQAVEFIKTHQLPRPLLNAFGEGGYVMYQFTSRDGVPDLLVPIDGRTNVNPGEIMEMNLSAYRGKQSWEEYLSVTKPKTILWKNASPLSAILVATGEWCRVFRNGSETEGYSVFITRGEFASRSLPSDNC